MNNDRGIKFVIQSILLTLYELKKDLLFLQHLHIQNSNLPKSQDEAIVKACNFILDRFPGFEIPEEAKKFYQNNKRSIL